MLHDDQDPWFQKWNQSTVPTKGSIAIKKLPVGVFMNIRQRLENEYQSKGYFDFYREHLGLIEHNAVVKWFPWIAQVFEGTTWDISLRYKVETGTGDLIPYIHFE